MNFKPFAAAFLVITSFGAVACSDGGTGNDAAAEANPTGLEVANARLVLPAVSGNPAAVYFDLGNKGDRNVAVRSASIEGASNAQMHDTMEWSGEMTMGEMGPLTIDAGDTVSFEPGGMHVMAFDLDPSLEAGGTTAMTLTVAGGKTVTADVAIVAAGDDR